MHTKLHIISTAISGAVSGASPTRHAMSVVLVLVWPPGFPLVGIPCSF